MEVKNKKVNPFILFINTLVNGGEDVKDEKLPKELEDSLKSIDKFFANLQAPVKKSGRKSLDDDLKVETKKVEPKKSVRKNTEKQIDDEREQ